MVWWSLGDIRRSRKGSSRGVLRGRSADGGALVASRSERLSHNRTSVGPTSARSGLADEARADEVPPLAGSLAPRAAVAVVVPPRAGEGAHVPYDRSGIRVVSECGPKERAAFIARAYGACFVLCALAAAAIVVTWLVRTRASIFDDLAPRGDALE